MMGKRMMKLKIVAASIFLILAGSFFFGSESVHAIIRPPQQGEATEFMEWYNLHKNDAEASYTLTSDIYLKENTQETYLLDGNGSIIINCNGYGIVAGAPLVIANDGLTLTGNGAFTLRGNADITLKAGKIANTGGGIALFMAKGILNAQGASDAVFRVESKGKDAVGIYYGGNDKVHLNNISVEIDGDGASKGIYSRIAAKISLEYAAIEVKGNAQSRGVWVAGNGEVILSNSSVRVNYGQDGAGGASIVAQRIDCADSFLYPDVITGETVYEILFCERLEPVIIPYMEALQGVNLPTEVSVNVKNVNTGMISEKMLPVQWEQPEINAHGSYLIKGQLLTDNSNLNYSNLEQVIPKISLFALPEEGMFLEGYEFFKVTANGRNRLMLSMPFPVGAYDVELQYSTDKIEWKTAYNQYGDKNWYNPNACTQDWFFSFALERPLMDDIFYLRTIIKGGIYEGTSQAWKLVASSNSLIPPEIAGTSGGDRGGQTLNPDKDRIDSNEKEAKKEQNTFTVNGGDNSEIEKEAGKPDTQAEAFKETQKEDARQESTEVMEEKEKKMKDNETQLVRKNADKASGVYTWGYIGIILMLVGILVAGSVILGVVTYRKKS